MKRFIWSMIGKNYWLSANEHWRLTDHSQMSGLRRTSAIRGVVSKCATHQMVMRLLSPTKKCSDAILPVLLRNVAIRTHNSNVSRNTVLSICMQCTHKSYVRITKEENVFESLKCFVEQTDYVFIFFFYFSVDLERSVTYFFLLHFD